MPRNTTNCFFLQCFKPAQGEEDHTNTRNPSTSPAAAAAQNPSTPTAGQNPSTSTAAKMKDRGVSKLTKKKSSYASPSHAQLASDAELLNMKVDLEEGSSSQGGPSSSSDGHTQTYTYDELKIATNSFSLDCCLGEGGFGKVYKGYLGRTNQEVAIKKLENKGIQGIREFVTEVKTLTKAIHPNLVKLHGFCAEKTERLLVYEFMSLGSLDSHLFDLTGHKQPLDWNTRMKIVAGAARGLQYLHTEMEPPIIHRDIKSSNILLDDEYNAKLSDFGLAQEGPSGGQSYVSTGSVAMGTHGYCSPAYARTGQLTFKSDVYSFGVVLLEIITGRRALDHLVTWARSLLEDRLRWSELADPLLRGQYPQRDLRQALAVAEMCVREDRDQRPEVGDVVIALDSISSQTYDPPQIHASPPLRRVKSLPSKLPLFL